MDIKKLTPKQFVDYLGKVNLSNQEAGQVYADLSSLYLKTQNNILKDYQEFLEDVAMELRALNAKEKSFSS